jgi:hypothetical protein
MDMAESGERGYITTDLEGGSPSHGEPHPPAHPAALHHASVKP